MNDILDHDSKNFLYRIVENILKKLVDATIDEIKRDYDAKKFLWDKEELARQCCMSVTEVEKKFVPDRRMKLIERQKGRGKLYWPSEQAKEKIKEIMDEWD